MNANTFRLIFSKRLGMRVPVAEQRSAQGKVASDKTAGRVLNPLAFSLTLLCVAPALALPVAPTVAHGSASFSQSGSTLTVTNTPNAIINWGSFSIGQNELTKFVQQSSASAVLNRVTGQSPSQILGQLQSNGRVFLINPNGIVFGQGARIDTAGLIASTLNLSDADFLAGKLRFSGTGSEAKVDNQGTINTAQGGFVYLIAPNVENSGLINAPNGDVLLAAGHSVEIADGLNPALRVVLTAPEGSVINLGQVLAESGRIGLHGGMVANSGVVSASSAVAEGGKIYLRATEKIELAEPSKLSANGTVGGEITAITQKDGQIAGELVARGEISAQGNGAAGSGGFVETSAANVMVDDGFKVSTRGGKWLIDPSDFTIAASGGNITGAALSNSLNNATSGGVTIFSSSGTAGGSGDINVNDTVSWSANTLTLTAARDININAVMTATGSARLTMNTATTNSDDTGVSGGTVRVGFNPDGSFKGRVDMASSTALTINGSPYTLINDPTALQGMGGNLIGKYALGSNINASDTSNWNSGLGFDPIGNGLGAEFVGAFDGLGHTISGLTINRPAEDDIGLFGRVSGAQLRNVGLTGASIRGNRYVGGLAGQVEHTLINNAYADVTLAGDQYLGGLIGNINYSDLGIGTNTRIDRSHSSGSVTSLGTYFYYVGGLVGNVYSWLGDGNETYITHSYATTTLTTNNSLPTDLGGLVGTLGEYSTIADSYATGNINVTGSLDRVGGLVGVANSDTSITRSYASGNITGGPDSNQTGGLIGALSNFSSVSQVYATGAVTTGANSQNLGGLVGEMGQYSTISNSYATGDVTAGDYGSTLGGLVGYNNSYFDGSISNSYATGAVSSGISSDQIGGLVGDHNGSLIENSYATGSVTAGTNSDGVGGLVGYQTYVSPIKYSYATGKVTTGSGTTRAGGLVGAGCSLTSTCSITSSYWDVDSTGRIDGVGSYPTNPGISGIYSATPTVNAYDQATYAGFDFATTWWMSETNTRPFLRMEWSNTITNAHQLQLMAISPSANYTLANNIDLAPALNAVSGLYPGMWGSAGFAPIGDATSGPFTGSFDGLDHTISGLTINRPGSNYVGLFGSTNNALISNIRLTSVSVAGLSYVGSLVGNSTGTNSSITNSYATGSVSGSANYVGGLVGWSDADISSSHAAVNVSATVNPMFVGGLVGFASANGSIEKSYASGSVVAGGSSTIYAGGLVGQSVTTLNESYATGNVTLANFSNNALIYAGGLTGSSMGTTAGISTSYATGNVSIASSDTNPSYEYIYAGGLAGSNTNGSAIGNSYSTGNVTVQASSQTTESGAYLGGLVGWHGGNSTSSIDNSYSVGAITAGGTHVALGIGGLIGIRTGTNTVTSSYWNLDTAGTALAVGSGTDIIGSGLSTAQMQLQASFSNWDFSTVWNIDAGSSVSYPYLRNPEQIPHPGLSGGITTCDVCSWDGGGGNNYLWSLSTNWANNLLPAAASTVTIGNG
jgi:filamentous hemagglutinin family protein